MKLSTRCIYGTRAMLEIARNYKNGPVKRQHIAKSQGISVSYLENILITLKTQCLIRTTRGARGGFTLETSPEKITMFQIITALEGSIAPVDCVENHNTCDRMGHCIAQKFWQNFYEIQVKFLKTTNLQTLLDLEITINENDFCI